MPVPGIATNVHYMGFAEPYAWEGPVVCTAAIVTIPPLSLAEDPNESVGVTVFSHPAQTVNFLAGIPRDESGHAAGTWHMPES